MCSKGVKYQECRKENVGNATASHPEIVILRYSELASAQATEFEIH